METIKVLLFAANPPGTAPLDLAREFREIDDEVGRSPYRSAVELILVPGARPVDLLRKLNENRPQVIHFSSHGDPDQIVLESDEPEVDAPDFTGSFLRSPVERDMKKLIGPGGAEAGGAAQGRARGVSKSALARVLRACGEGNLRLVFLNACHTRPQAEALTEVVDCVVSMTRTISDRAAIKFAASFYGALAFGSSVRNAFEQGVARLSLEAIAEVDTPELLVRPGDDAARIVLIGAAPGVPATPAAEAPFLVPFPRNDDFVGRDDDLARLHASLTGAGSGPVGIRPAGLTGMGGIGKTQLAVEYVHRRRYDHPDGVFWIDAAGPLAEGFARLATDPRLRWIDADRPRDDRIRAAFAALNARPHSLLVLDNLPDPSAIAVPLLPGCTPEDLRCRLLFTTRRHDLGRFAGVEVTILPEEPALRLLLRHPSRRAALDPAHPDHEHARAIARMLGRLPLALELAGAYLGKFSGHVSMEGYREGLKSDGALATLDADAAELSEADLRRVHDPAVAATLGEQWEALQDEPARLLLRVASLFPESSAVPIARLGLLAGLTEEARPGRLSTLRRSVQRLDDACLVERLEAEQIRLHPLIGEFAAARTPPEQVEDFRRECAARTVAVLEDYPNLEALDGRRGLDGLQEDLIAILEICPPSAAHLGARLQALLRLLQREAHNLRDTDPGLRPTWCAQQVRNRASLLGLASLKSSAERRLTELGRPHFRLLWTASRESRELIRTLCHEDWVSAIAVSPDSCQAFSGSGDGMLSSWDLRTGQLLRTFAGHEDAVSDLAVSPDGRRVLSSSHDRTLKLWDVATGQLLRNLPGQEDMVFAAATSPDGRRAVAGSRDGTLRLWDLETGELLRTLNGHEDGVCAATISPDARRALSGSRDRTLKLWDLQTGRLLRTLAGHEDMVFAATFDRDGRRALSGSGDRTLKLWDLETGRLLRTFAGHEEGINAVAMSPDGRRALSGSDDRTLRLWDLRTGQVLRTLAGHDHAVSAVTISPDGRHGLSGSDDRTIKLWDIRDGRSPPPTAGHEGPVTVVAMSPDGHHALSGSHDRTLRLWDLETGQVLRSFAGHDNAVIAAMIPAGGRRALSGSYDRTLRLWDLGTGQLLRTFAGREWLSSVTVPPSCLHQILDFWSPGEGRETRTTRRMLRLAAFRMLQRWVIQLSYSEHINAVATTANGRCALAGSHDGTLTLWDFRTGRFIRTFAGHLGPVHAVALAPDERHALSGSADCTLRLWEVATGRLLHSFAGHTGPVISVAVCPDGRHALSGSRDRTLRLWDLEERSCRAIGPLESAPQAIAVAIDGRAIVVGDRVGNIHHFEIHLN